MYLIALDIGSENIVQQFQSVKIVPAIIISSVLAICYHNVGIYMIELFFQ